MVLHNPNNWHWVNKDASGWAKEYLEKKLVGLAAEENGVTAKIHKVVSMEGDVDVSQRKGKVITLFDVVLRLEYEGECTPRRVVYRVVLLVVNLILLFTEDISANWCACACRQSWRGRRDWVD